MMSHIPGTSDAARARELYKYYQPPAEPAPPENPGSSNELNVRSDVSSSKMSSPDSALTAFCQLVSWRTGTQRAMISVIDLDTQYFIAESTKTLDILDATKHTPGDGLWLGCSKVDKAGRLCERTIALPPAPTGEYPAFIVSDLSKDDRFNQLPFVTGPPFLKFYAGVPLITKRGIPIGSLFVVDDRPRGGLGLDKTRFMGTIASTIMRHMEMVREVEQHRRGMKMSRGLASFVEGRSELLESDTNITDEEGSTVAGQFEITSTTSMAKSTSNRNSRAGSQTGSISSIERKEKEYSSAMLQTEEKIMTLSERGGAAIQLEQFADISDSHPAPSEVVNMGLPLAPAGLNPKNAVSPGSTEESEVTALKILFARAANLIREAFEVDGGSVFYDAQRGFGNDYSPDAAAENITNPEDFSSEESRSSSDSTHVEMKGYGKSQKKPHLSSKSRSGIFHNATVDSQKTVEILAFSTPTASSVNSDDYPGGHSFTKLDEMSLHSFLRRYPRGKLWTFGQDGCISSSEDDILKPLQRTNTRMQSKRKRARTDSEALILLKHFPGVRQILFVPLWDSSRSRWLSANFTWSTEPTRILTKQSELLFLTAFGNSVMAECSRLDTETADQKKGDFIGSVSHELRSPLHGILASAEFLSEEVAATGAGAFTRGLVETIDSCGRTLLDTINHILDFSKINHLEKNWRRSRRAGHSISRPGARTMSSFAMRKADLPMINLFADVDISIVCEEVVEGVFAGHVFQNVTAPSFDRVADSRGKMSDTKRYVSSSGPILDSEDLSHYPDVAVILDIDVQNYHFTTQPGAFRRVIMNLLEAMISIFALHEKLPHKSSWIEALTAFKLGNALKYTSRGYVKIKLEATEMEDLQPAGTTESIPRACVILTISDTGRGISGDFVRTKLFTPFAQENSLSSGTGLGLSIVRSIVALLEGEISIQSELGRGTEVKVTLPLLRELPKGESSGSTPKSVASVPKESEEVIDQLRPRVIGKTVSLHGFNSDSKDSTALQTNQLLKASVKNFLLNWYGLKVVAEREISDIIIFNEPNPTDTANLVRLRRSNKRGPVVLALCSHSSRFDREYANTEANADVGFLAKPIGPLKLARALSQCLDGISLTATPGLEKVSSAGTGSMTETTDLSSIFEDLSLSPSGGEILDNSRMAADSENARKAIESPTPTPGIEKTQEFPFPSEPERPTVATASTMPTDKESLRSIGSGSSSDALDALSKMENAAANTAAGPTPVSRVRSVLPAPRALLVDDNKINLRLLRTYMRRRNYSIVDEAENGLEAVDAMQNREEGYDIIFMDISMPILDGFGATRQIRQIERARKDKAGREGVPPPLPALVIALTGLASSRDQSEAFKCGVDLFLTKPVAFKEVGKMLDNWEANREREARSADETPNNTSSEEQDT